MIYDNPRVLLPVMHSRPLRHEQWRMWHSINPVVGVIDGLGRCLLWRTMPAPSGGF
jgi:hypothetical protein